MVQVRVLTAALAMGGVLSGCCLKCRKCQETVSPPVPAVTALNPESARIESMIQDVTSSSPGNEAELGNVLRIATYNIQNLTDGEGDGWRRTRLVTSRQLANAAKIISEINADILTIQEIENLAVLERLNRQLETPFAHLYISQFDSSARDRKLNIAVASRLRMLDVVELDFSAATKSPVKLSRGAVRFMLQLGNNRNLLGYGVHLKSNYGDWEQNILKRKISTDIIRSDIEAVIAAHPEVSFEVVILGDFNVDPDLPKWDKDPSLSALDDWVDLWRGVPLEVRTTLAKRLGDPQIAFDPVCFDRIIVSPSLTQSPWKIKQPVVKLAGVDTNNIYVSPGQNDIHVSDHYPVYVDIMK